MQKICRCHCNKQVKKKVSDTATSTTLRTIRAQKVNKKTSIMF